MKVIYQGKLIELDPKQAIGDGGEANVIRYQNLAFKIYHEPTILRARKLSDFLNSKFTLPKNVMAPVDTVMDKQGRIIGFTMNIAQGCKDAMNLSKNDFRNQQQITINDIVKYFLHSKFTLEQIHQTGLIVGDLNDLNQLFDANFESYYIDVDSFQFAKHPCIVGTEDYLHPKLYGVDLTKSPMFSIETDLYSFAVMLFRSLLFVHPYAGVHKKHKSLFSRAQNKIWVFDNNVIKPKVAMNPEILSDDLLKLFEDTFSKGLQIDITSNILNGLQNTFTKCTKCGIHFSDTRSKCPVCQKVIPQQTADVSSIIANKQIGNETCIVNEIFGIEGAILFCKVVAGERIFVVYFDGKETKCKYILDSFALDIKLWDGIERSAIFDFIEPYCLVVHFANQLMLFDIKQGKLKPITKTLTSSYKGQPIFSASRDFLYRLTSKSVLKGQLVNNNLIEQEVASVIEDQTWVKVGQNDLGFGFYRVFSKYQFFIFSKKGRFEIELEDLKGQIIDLDVQFSLNSVLLLRKNLDNGRTYSHLHIIDDTGKVIEKRSEESLSSDLLRNIYGKAFAGSVIIHPTDAGIATEKHGNVSLKVSTADYVNSNSQIQLYKQGLLVVSNNKITYLTLKS